MLTGNTAEIMSKGMRCLRQQLGIVEAEQFISLIMREQFDYTKWHQTAFDDLSAKELLDAAAEYAVQHPYQGQAKIIL